MAHSLLADISSLVLTLLKFLWDFTVNLEVRKLFRYCFPTLSIVSSIQGQCLPIEMANRLEKVQQVRKNLLNAAAGSLSKLPLPPSTNVPAVLLRYHYSYHTTTLMLLSITIFLLLLTTTAVFGSCG